ncbi:hypothetical protein NMY22_g2568 [Coprinellus aureogranulatus]|nr:hypothetical protein NMY22_g2568 [Coprinellus aureogranulatus]
MSPSLQQGGFNRPFRRIGRFMYHPGGARSPPPPFSLHAPIPRGLQADWPPTPEGGWKDESPTVTAQEIRARRLAGHNVPRSLDTANKENDDPVNLFRVIMGNGPDAKFLDLQSDAQPGDSSGNRPPASNVKASLHIQENAGTLPNATHPWGNGCIAPMEAAYNSSEIGGAQQLRDNGSVFSTAVGLPLSVEFVAGVRFLSYDPRKPTPSNAEVMQRLGEIFSPGITKAELRQILRRCKGCRRFMFLDRCEYHQCDGNGPDIKDPQFHLASALLATTASPGISQTGLSSLLSICQTCRRIVATNGMDLHICGEYDHH